MREFLSRTDPDPIPLADGSERCHNGTDVNMAAGEDGALPAAYQSPETGESEQTMGILIGN